LFPLINNADSNQYNAAFIGVAEVRDLGREFRVGLGLRSYIPTCQMRFMHYKPLAPRGSHNPQRLRVEKVREGKI